MGYVTSLSHPVASPAAAVSLIDQLLIQHKSTFKRKTLVGLYVSTQSPPPAEELPLERRQALRRLGVMPPVAHQPADSYAITIRPTDITDPTQQSDAQWLWAAAKATTASSVPSST